MRPSLLSIRLSFFFACLAGIAVGAPGQSSSSGGGRGESVEVTVTADRDLGPRLAALGYSGHDVDLRVGRRIEIARFSLLASELPQLRSDLGPTAVVGITRLSRPYRETALALQQAAGTDMPIPEYRTTQEVADGLLALETGYPAIVKRYDLQSRYGVPTTHDGNSIFVLRISDRPDVDEDEPNLLVFANNHSRELNSIEAPFMVAERLVQGYGIDPVLTALVDENQIWILPNMNPDGLDYVWNQNDMWRKNRRDNGDGTFGVDLNRNYEFAWATCGSSSRTSSGVYHGPAAMSEPESVAMREFTLAEGFERMIDIHSFSRDVRLPFNPRVINDVPSFFRGAYDRVHAAVAQAMNYAQRTTCCCGTHMEWHHGQHGTLGMLIEMGLSLIHISEPTRPY